MKIKTDFVTNSSSTSYIIEVVAEYKKQDGETKKIHKYLQDVTTLDCVKSIEGILQYIEKLEGIVDITYTQTVFDVLGDGWNGEDYNFNNGEGWRFLGDSDILSKVMIKHLNLTFVNDKLLFPEKWATECEQEVIIKKFKPNHKEEEYDEKI